MIEWSEKICVPFSVDTLLEKVNRATNLQMERLHGSDSESESDPESESSTVTGTNATADSNTGNNAIGTGNNTGNTTINTGNTTINTGNTTITATNVTINNTTNTGNNIGSAIATITSINNDATGLPNEGSTGSTGGDTTIASIISPATSPPVNTFILNPATQKRDSPAKKVLLDMKLTSTKAWQKILRYRTDPMVLQKHDDLDGINVIMHTSCLAVLGIDHILPTGAPGAIRIMIERNLISLFRLL